MLKKWSTEILTTILHLEKISANFVKQIRSNKDQRSSYSTKKLAIRQRVNTQRIIKKVENIIFCNQSTLIKTLRLERGKR